MKAFIKSITFYLFGYFAAVFGGVSSEHFDGVRIEVGGVRIRADHLSFEDPLARVSGNVRITGENFYGRCRDLTYDVRSKDIHINGIDIGIDRGYASAEEASFTQERITLKDADIGINAEMDGMIPHMKAKRVIYDRAKEKGIAQSAYLKIGNIPLFIPPITVGDWIRSVDMRLDTGYTSKLGGYFQSEMTYNVYEDLHLGGLFNIYTKRGVLMGPVVKIDSEGESMTSRVKLRTGYIVDRGKRDADIDGTPIGKKRWIIDGKQVHHFGQNIDILSDFLWASDGKMGENFHLDWTEDSDVRDSFGELDYRGENDLWTIFTRVKMNHYQDFSQQIPSLRFERFPQEIGDSGLYYFGYIDFTRQKFTREHSTIPEQWEKIEQNRIDSYWGINRPMELANGIHFTPLVGGRWTRYCGECDRFLGELGLDWEANFYAHYPQSIPWLKAKEWKHIVRPIVQYRYQPKLGKRRSHRAIETKKKDSFLPILDLSEMRYVDDLEEQNILRLGLENDYFAKGENGKIRKIATFDVYQDLRFKRNINAEHGQEKTFSDLYLLSELNPRRWLNLRLYTRLNWEHFSLEETNGEINFSSGDLWELGFRAKILRHRVAQFGIHFCFRFNAISQLNFETQIDGRSGKFLALEIAYETRWSSVWDVKFFCKIKNHSSREGRLQPGFLINLLQW
ncbi:MAG: LPS assembly protein LptD [Puniceicoccales bacterium]|nr:LPS assembly protein LptD [Puniceicoccales bacterium]